MGDDEELTVPPHLEDIVRDIYVRAIAEELLYGTLTAADCRLNLQQALQAAEVFNAAVYPPPAEDDHA